MRLDRRGVVGLSAAAAGLAALLVLVLLRGPIVETAVKRVLAWRGVQADFDVTVLDFDRAVVERLVVGPADSPSLAAERIEARYGLLGALRGQVRSLDVDGFMVRVTVDGRGARLEGVALPAGDGKRSGRPSVTPQVTITDGRAYVATPAGEVAADLSLVGGPEDGWSIELSAQPGTLAQGDATLTLSSGALTASVAEGALSVDGEVRLGTLAAGGATVRDAAAVLRFRGMYDDAARLGGLRGEGALDLSLGQVAMTPDAGAQWASRLLPETEGLLDEAFGAHAAALRAALAQAFADMSGDAAFSIAIADGRAVFEPEGEVALSAANGARVTLESSSDVGGAFVYDSRTGELSARDLSIEALFLGVLDARALLEAASLRRERDRTIASATLRLSAAPWDAGELVLAAEAARLHLARDGGAWRAEVDTELRASGARFGVAAQDAVVRLDLTVAGDQNGLAVSAPSDGLQRITAARVSAGTVTLADLQASLVAMRPDAPLLGVDASGVRIESALREARASVVTGSAAPWLVQLPASEVTARFGADGARELRAYVQAPRLQGMLGAWDTVVQASVIDADLLAGPEGRARMRFEELELGGPGFPLRISHAAGELDAALADGAPREGRLLLTNAEVVDTAGRARLVPLTFSGEAPLSEGVLAGSFLGVGGDKREIVRVSVQHNFAEGAGMLTVATPRFTFTPQGLQPRDISPILRGPLVNVMGAARAEASVAWDPAGLQSAGMVELDNLAFDMRFGRVEGLATRFEVADLLNVRTAETQRISIGLIDPGLPLRDGVLEVDLRGPTRTRLASARFPFAGGQITASPAEIEWTSSRNLVVLLADGISLSELDEMFKPPDLDITGSLSGSIPVEARGRSVFITGGSLVSDGPGRVSYTGRAGEGLAQQNENTKLAFDALKNFEYDRMVLTLDGDVAGRLQANVRLEGRNPDLLDGFPINFNLNTSAEFARLLTRAFSGLSLSAARRGAAIEGVQADEPPSSDAATEEAPFAHASDEEAAHIEPLDAGSAEAGGAEEEPDE